MHQRAARVRASRPGLPPSPVPESSIQGPMPGLGSHRCLCGQQGEVLSGPEDPIRDPLLPRASVSPSVKGASHSPSSWWDRDRRTQQGEAGGEPAQGPPRERPGAACRPGPAGSSRGPISWHAGPTPPGGSTLLPTGATVRWRRPRGCGLGWTEQGTPLDRDSSQGDYQPTVAEPLVRVLAPRVPHAPGSVYRIPVQGQDPGAATARQEAPEGTVLRSPFSPQRDKAQREGGWARWHLAASRGKTRRGRTWGRGRQTGGG